MSTLTEPPDAPSRRELLKEYELALTSLHNTNTAAYTATGLFLTLSLAGAAYFLRIDGTIYWSEVAGALVVRAFSSGLVVAWRRFLETLRVRNWISMFRAREIEAALGLRHEIYVDNVYYPDPHRCSEHGYQHEDPAEAVEHLRDAASRGTQETLLSPFWRLLLHRDPYPLGTVGSFWDMCTVAIPTLWLAVVLIGAVTRVARG